jgi:hypothetical protein
LVVRPDEVDNYLESLKFRKAHPEELVQIRYVNVKKEETEYCKMEIFFEHISFNLEQAVSLHFKQMLSMLYYALKGFSILFKKWGSYFTI